MKNIDRTVRAYVDSYHLSKVILNLLLNALDALEGKDGKIIIDVGAQNGKVYFSVKDSGCGMSQEFIRNNLFKPFSSTKKKGMGIGLYQSKSIIEAHGGRIEAESRQKEGTVFRVELPSPEESGPREGSSQCMGALKAG